ncbi:FYVE zinc finger domain-containing protein [Phytophthora infestans]|uniref:FYVE zinc finger domain-containing protein n=1 Tax=Phytophthora infestans TaxID=4787 RepID=A0A833WZE2_PHYIN|nr:FYVE zinc finger domain-containing protein [Phytophthora infestans]KAF4130073.1 FYVE zinc finger domain-containing protein [Phytophthora infestans]
MVTHTPKVFAPVSLSRSQAEKLEAMMKQQVQDAIQARTAQLAKDNTLDPKWRFVNSLGQLKTFKLRGTDSFCSTSSWATTLNRSTRATACNVNDRISTGSHTWTMRSRSSVRSRHRRLSFSRRTVGATVGHRDFLSRRPPLQSFRTFGRVQGNYRDIVDAHYASSSEDFVRQQKLLSPVVIDCAVLHTIRATKDSYLGIKWIAENSFAGKRDVCFVEIVGYTTNTNGQEIGFVAMASVDVPECPELTGSMKLTRVRMKRTMLVVPSFDTPKATSDVFVMGATETSESSITAHAQYRFNMAVLNDISLVIDSQNIATQTLALHKNWVPDENRPSCSICSRKFHFMYRRRHHCRLCGDVVCKTCYVTRAVPGADMGEGYGCKPADDTAICQTKFCVRCVMGLRAIDKRLDKFSQQISKMLSLNVDTLNMSRSNVENQLPGASGLDSSITYFKRGSKQKYTLDLDQLYKVSALHNNTPEVDGDFETNSIKTSYLVSYGSGGLKYLRPSLSMDPLHSDSYGKLSVRSSSVVSQGEPVVFEEKVILNMNKLSRIVAI